VQQRTISQAEFEQAVLAAEKELGQAETADDVRRIWKKYYLTIGHRSMGRLLVGRPAADLIARRQARSE
jgi:hypothetical protein